MISVCITAFNEERSIEYIVRRVLGQDCTELTELLIVDDGSTDRTPEICDSLEAEFEKVHLIKQSNKGPGGARNTAISNAKGDFVIFIDSDDDVTDDYLQKLVSNLDEENDIFSFAYERIDKKKQSTQVNPRKNRETPIWASCFRLRYLQNNNFRFIEKSIYEDNALMSFIFRATENKKLIDVAIYKYIYTTGSISNRKTLSNVYGRIKSTTEYLNNAQKHGFEVTDTDYRDKISHWFADALASSFCREGSYDVLLEVIDFYTSLDARAEQYLNAKGKFILKTVSKFGYGGYLFLVMTKLSRKLK